jgi:hypothetical protein
MLSNHWWITCRHAYAKKPSNKPASDDQKSTQGYQQQALFILVCSGTTTIFPPPYLRECAIVSHQRKFPGGTSWKK